MTDLNLTVWIADALSVAHRSMDFMLWNTFLALIPLVLSLWLFRFSDVPFEARDCSSADSLNTPLGIRRLSWWLGCALFIAFLPNAPYVLTDIIHLVSFIQSGASLPTIVLILIPQYLIFMLIGTEAYVLSLINLGRYLVKRGWRQWVLAAELTLHLLCAIGIYLGRFPRFNSWDIVTGPQRLVLYVLRDLLRPEPMMIILVTFVVIAALYWPLKQVSLAMIWYWRSREQRRQWN
ncbi:DUF1361 domain-containing protein [cf. Phormidesmis sp. LEGE 11477]|uniref:DUF1361 domain-containing protein n=1 Tax=cf. Phormidesmis sp. LEGE 11477 TaxID=1828680 RepID=UPI0018808128|nr:DUF1361 domain-containing protein [cf. Phormidesmis sp. LEGE 11477]MBE9064522.1 DUF1361 domain-containing protein [cf. Phormidesmis sp. LEGE 11477]